MGRTISKSPQTVSSQLSCAHLGVLEIAIVDDEDFIRLVLCKILEDSGQFRCVGSYANGEEAVRGVPGVRPDAVVMDIRMPGISGIECMRLLKVSIKDHDNRLTTFGYGNGSFPDQITVGTTTMPNL